MELGAEEVHAIAEWRLVGPGRIVGYSDIGPIRPSRRRVWAWLYTLPRFWAFRVNLTHSFQLPSGPLTDQHRLVELAGAQCRRSTLFVRPQRRTNAHLVQRAGDSKGAGSKRILRHEAYRVFWLSLNIRRAAANIDRAAHHVQGGIAPRYGNLGDHQTAQVLATAATGLRRLFLCFCFFSEVFGDPMPVLPGPPPHAPTQSAGRMISAAGLIFAGTALPEEILFRSLIQNLLMLRFGAGARTLLAAAFIFGCAHLDNGPLPLPNWHYMILATIAGVAYGAVFRKAPTVLSSAALHMLVDWTKHFFF